MSRRIAFGIGVVFATACVAVAAPPGRTAPPSRPPDSSFTPRVDNPWFPLRPGSRYVYRGVKDGRPSRDVVTVAHRTATIDGVPCAVVEDRLYVSGRLAERTTDWYTQDRLGNVWYFGEDTAELDAGGKVTSTEGSWRAGSDGARPGIFMPAHPRVGQAGQQEYYKGQAEDRYRVIALFRKVVGGSTGGALLTEETTPLEPGVVDHKLYVRGIGTVLEQTEKGGDERNELVTLTRS
jgi:hypothetical protein